LCKSCRTCFMFYRMFYFTCDRSLTPSWARPRGTPAIEITAVTSSCHVTSSVTSPFDSGWSLTYRLLIVNNLKHAHTPDVLYQTPPTYTPQPWAGELRHLVHVYTASTISNARTVVDSGTPISFLFARCRFYPYCATY